MGSRFWENLGEGLILKILRELAKRTGFHRELWLTSLKGDMVTTMYKQNCICTMYLLLVISNLFAV